MKCKYCTKKAVKKIIWADGRAFISVCDNQDHEARAIYKIETQNDRVTKIVRI